MQKITPEMRKSLRMPLPPEAVTPHPTKTYLSTIKSIYVVERINDVFGLGTWTLKSEVVESGEHAIVVKAVLEIPEYGFYGEAFGGNDNADRGDAYKGSTTDALTKISAQQLEIGMDVYKGLQTGKQGGQTDVKKEHWCEKHNTAFFKRGKMLEYAHPIKDTGEWCNEIKLLPANPPTPTPAPAQSKSDSDKDFDNLQSGSKEKPSPIDEDWLDETLKLINWKETTAISYIKNTYKVVVSATLDQTLRNLPKEIVEKFYAKLKEMREVAGK